MAGRSLESGKIDWSDIPTPATRQEILGIYDSQHDEVTSCLMQLNSKSWAKEVAFIMQGHELRRAEGCEFAWEFLFDQVHHRGQLSTYLRPMGSTVPSIYGPSADEPF
ncbi:MAG: hypothetical protein H0T92_24045 [Pyrinomonadaceae bacterium]|nr:hypothetical protein [Pyrinomonadaceae bacterium]